MRSVQKYLPQIYKLLTSAILRSIHIFKIYFILCLNNMLNVSVVFRSSEFKHHSVLSWINMSNTDQVDKSFYRIKALNRMVPIGNVVAKHEYNQPDIMTFLASIDRGSVCTKWCWQILQSNHLLQLFSTRNNVDGLKTVSHYESLGIFRVGRGRQVNFARLARLVNCLYISIFIFRRQSCE